ncbi:pimeloyl-ACP methyl ester carboxylesterase [Paenibacillus cellulosilyticus]|uniref:Pimeloyl-ACP methyl ester carboxylesterase n=1 Tax=Paenibacillus cellulosilyticus TaxID=375489 RepID=A0A2V2YTK0_9BACL|nr:alpha/beta hydrolase [Paenibacillus cellulosilyticus]PWW02441.1 pimeloyl-ACP methyl ester carboxylesterase [Paenibacillus cellulosilyticus]QKS47150.1 alpha/beta hydrolase [Paenibacillus cellulosilyticus]
MVKVFKNEIRKTQVLDSYNRILEKWSVDFQEHDVIGRFGTTHCITSGSRENPPLLLFHGVGDNSAIMWILNMKELSRSFYCIAVDTLGGPGKSIPNVNYKKKSFNQVEWINEIVNHFKINNFNIAGVSNGAYMAYNFTTVNSERVNKVVCMEGGMVTKPLKTMIQTLLLMFPEILIPTHQNLLKVIKKLSSPNSDVFQKHPSLAEHLVLLMKNHNQQAMFAHKIEKYDSEKAASVRDKLYFLIGEHGINHKKDFIMILDNGGFQYKVIPNAGHGINHEQPDVINNEIVQFLLK